MLSPQNEGAAADARLRRLMQETARALEESFLVLVSRSRAKKMNDAPFAATASNGALEAVDCKVSVSGVRRFLQTCGLILQGSGNPSLAQADVQLQSTSDKGRMTCHQVTSTVFPPEIAVLRRGLADILTYE